MRMVELACLVMGLALLGAVGCGVGPGVSGGAAGSGGSSGTAGSGGTGGGLVCPEDPVKGTVAPECGIWVSVSLGDDAHDGSQGAPVASLTHAVELAAQGPGRVYACGGETWTEPLTVSGHVSLYGGFDCAAGWAYVGAKKRAILAPPSTIALTWEDDTSDEVNWFTDFHVESADAIEPGGSSIAVFVRDDLRLALRRVDLVAGDGMDGLDGTPAEDGQAPAGEHGNDGGAACSAPVSPGGVSPESTCDFGTSKGGAGGNAGPLLAADGADGEPAANPPNGVGGLGEQSAPACTPGQLGANGMQGSYGVGAHGKGRLTVDGYVGFDGEDGKPGAPGQGGGGGGGSFGKAAVCGAVNPGGAAGGSGGSGGCGGKSGGGGKAGGASIALATRSKNQLTIHDSVVTIGRGGKGGDGGKAQFGGKGGLAGQGGAGAGSIKAGCAGGMGGAGGRGGWGGGGMGGPSAWYAFLEPMGIPPTRFNVEEQMANPGSGGLGETGVDSNANGSAGDPYVVACNP